MTLVCVALLCAQSAWALDPTLDMSQYAHTAWRLRDGFVKGTIFSIAQTPDGYLWLATDFGLYRFDGVRAVPWQPPAGQQLPTTYIISLMVSRDGTLWIGTEKGLASWKGGKLTNYQQLAGRLINSLLEDHKGTIWVGDWESQTSGNGKGNGRLCAIRNGSVECYGTDGSLGEGVLSLYEDGKGNVWAGGGRGFWRWGPGIPEFHALGKQICSVQSFAEDEDGALLIAVANMGLLRLAEGRVEQHRYHLPQSASPRPIYRMQRDQDGALWIGLYGGGLLHVNQDRTDAFTQADGLSGDAINALFEDHEGNIWVATTDGLDRFRNFTIPTWSVRQGLPFRPGGAVLAAGDGSIWTGSARGLGRLDQGQVTIYSQRHVREASLAGRDVRETVHHELPDSFLAFLQDHDGRIWVSSMQGRLGFVEGQQYHTIGPVGTNTLDSIAEDSNRDLWVGGREEGLFRLHEGEIAEKVPWAALGRKEICDRLAVDPSRGGLWIACRSGGISYFEDGQVRASYSASSGLGQGVVNDLRFGPGGALWAATESGLSRIKDAQVTTLTSKNGLPCDTVHWTIEDDDHFVWLYMACGLVRIARSDLDGWVSDPRHHVQATVLDASDGVRSAASPTGYSPQVSKAPDGKIWFVELDGLSVIDPRHLPFNKLPPPVHVEQITADRKSYDPATYANGHVPLPARTRDLQIDFTALSLVVPEKVRFRYKLEGRDGDWQDAGNRRQAFYSDLPPRKYRFRVMACNNSGVWNEEGASLDFSIAPAYYQTWWFRLSCVAAFLVLLWALYQLRLRQVAREFNMQLEGRVSERTRIARELHDTLLQSLHGLLLQFQAARNMLPRRPEEAIHALDGALDATEQAITESRDAIQDIRGEPGCQGDLAELLMAAGQELANSQDANHRPPVFRLIVEGERQALPAVLQGEVYRVAREILRNAFQHAQADRIEAEIRYDDHALRLRIRDDGRGIDPQFLKDGGRSGHWGLRGVRERVQQIGAQLDFWSEAGAGTEVQLTVPAAVAYEQSRHGSSRDRSGMRASAPGKKS